MALQALHLRVQLACRHRHALLRPSTAHDLALTRAGMTGHRTAPLPLRSFVAKVHVQAEFCFDVDSLIGLSLCPVRLLSLERICLSHV